MSRNTVARDRVCKLRRSSSVVTRALSAFSGFSQAQSVSLCHSYHLARWKNAALTAFEAGHAEGILFRHYRELVTPEAARAFFDCYPTGFTGPRYQPETLV